MYHAFPTEVRYRCAILYKKRQLIKWFSKVIWSASECRQVPRLFPIHRYSVNENAIPNTMKISWFCHAQRIIKFALVLSILHPYKGWASINIFRIPLIVWYCQKYCIPVELINLKCWCGGCWLTLMTSSSALTCSGLSWWPLWRKRWPCVISAACGQNCCHFFSVWWFSLICPWHGFSVVVASLR